MSLNPDASPSDNFCASVGHLSYNQCKIAQLVCSLQARIDALEAAETTQLVHVANLLETAASGNPPPTTGVATMWEPRLVNSVEGDATGVGVTFDPVTGAFTLPPGIYEIIARAPAYNAGSHQVRLLDANSGTTVAIGSSAHTPGATTGQTDSVLMTRLDITTTMVYILEHWIESGVFGFPASTGEMELYAQIRIKKLE